MPSLAPSSHGQHCIARAAHATLLPAQCALGLDFVFAQSRSRSVMSQCHILVPYVQDHFRQIDPMYDTYSSFLSWRILCNYRNVKWPIWRGGVSIKVLRFPYLSLTKFAFKIRINFGEDSRWSRDKRATCLQLLIFTKGRYSLLASLE